MSGAEDLARLTQTIDKTNELLLSPVVKMVDVGGGEMRPSSAMVMTNLSTLLGGAMPYDSVELGLESTVDGTNFSVLSSAEDLYVNVYRNVEGGAFYVDSYPNAKATRYGITQADLALELSPSRMLSSQFASAQTDEFGTPILGVKKSGVAFGLFDELPGLFFLSGEWRYVQVDEDGVILFGQRWNGTTLVYGVTSGSDASAYLVDDSGQSDVWLHAEGADFQITTSGSNWDPSVSDGLVRYLSRVGVNVQRVQEELPAVNQLAAFIRKILHIPSHGQSLSLGVHSVIQTTQPPVANRAFTIAVGLRQSDSLQAATLAPESVLPLKSLVSNLQEAPHAQLCAGLSRHRDLPADAGVVGSCHGVGATTILGLSKGTVSYNNLITAVTQCKADATSRGLEYSVPFVDWIQGEANSTGSQGNYLAALIQLQADLTADIGAISGDSNIPLVLCQMSSWTTKNITTSFVPLEQLQASIDHPENFICAGPKYWLDYHTDGVHLTGNGSVQLAAMHRAPSDAAIDGAPWKPTQCTKAVRNGTTVTLTFHTPSGPLVKDTVNVTDPGNLGIRWIDSTSSASVTAVAVNDDNTVTLTLSTVPTGSSPRVGIADIGISGALGGPTTGPRACLRDSNTELDGMGNPFYNWACHQIISVE